MDYVREQLLEEINTFFVGPRSDTDPLPEGNAPIDMYVSGILFPRNAPQDDFDKDANDGDGDAKEDSQGEGESEKFFKQNSIGLRVEVKKGIEKIKLVVNYGKYTVNKNGIWERHELGAAKQVHELVLSKTEDELEILDDSNSVEAKIWWKFYDKTVLNVFLENPKTWTDQEEEIRTENQTKERVGYQEATKRNNENSTFQPSISLESIDGNSSFQSVSITSKFYKSVEDDLFDMLYRNKKVFGSGYGCAAEWEDGSNPSYVRTRIIPAFQDDEIAKFTDDKDDPLKPALVDMYDLCCFEDMGDYAANRKTIREKLSPLLDKYRKWILEKTSAVETELAGTGYGEIGMENMKKCSDVLARIEDGYKLLTDENEGDGDRIVKAFVLANRAMLYQRLHFVYALKNFKNKKDVEWPNAKIPGQSFWYPFQIAFILMSLRGIAFKNHDDNSVVDLIWFPTGGGKTEAYLGVAAFTMLLRRLRGGTENSLGVSVIMRYTLRLLTLQQFERASTLICALEYLRRKVKGSGLGDEPFLLGLWVGYSLTPNHFQSSNEALKLLKTNPHITPSDGSPCQTNYCPWCGYRLNPYPNFKFDSKTKWTLVRCTNESSPCIFTNKSFVPDKILPLVTVDSDIYTRCPTMIIATVDKFARLPFRPDIANIFGRFSRKCELHGFLPREKHPNCGINGEGTHPKGSRAKVRNVTSIFPPDLIIQDELHLITGPLGTMVGLYETAVDFLTRITRNGKELRPKVIVSTATIKGAQDQVRKIFNRAKTLPFPPPGIERKDSFFWWETGKKGKLFVGVSFSQRSGKYALAKLYAALLQKTHIMRSLPTMSDDRVDPYWTLVGYYNSIRELGGANRLVEDDVVQNIDFLADAVYQNPEDARDLGTPENGIDELTGRKTQKEINEIRDKLERSLPDRNVISVLLATNMISVGIDIDRLALMAVNGQPKTITEYIQATGRIGRRQASPGSVFILFNPYKPRDLSHYENFSGFHSMMQKHVEPSTLTPFSIPSYHRALHAVLIAMIRLSNPSLAEKTSAENFEISDGSAATKFILERFKSVEMVDDDSDSYKEFKTKLITLQEQWEKFIRDTRENTSLHESVWYNNPYDKWHDDEPKNPSVLMIEFAKQGKQESDTFPLSTPESLRDVEQQIEMEYV